MHRPPQGPERGSHPDRPDGPGPEPSSGPDRPQEAPSSIQAGLEPLFTDPGLRPLLVVGMLTLSTFGAALVALALEDRNLAAIAALALLAGLTVYAVDTERRAAPAGRLVWVAAVLWGLSLAGGLLYACALPG